MSIQVDDALLTVSEAAAFLKVPAATLTVGVSVELALAQSELESICVIGERRS